MSTIDTRLRQIEHKLGLVIVHARPTAYEWAELFRAGRGTPLDVAEVMPEDLDNLRCDLVEDSRYLAERRSAGLRTEITMIEHFAACLLAVPLQEPIPWHLRSYMQKAWNRCWPLPFGLAEFKGVEQFGLIRSCIIFAALESPTADAFRARIRDGEYDDLDAIRTANEAGGSRLERLGDREISIVDWNGRSCYYDDLGNKTYRDDPTSRIAPRHPMDVINSGYSDERTSKIGPLNPMDVII
jgi:hypothetical protein